MKRNRIAKKSLSIAFFVFTVGIAFAATRAAWAKGAHRLTAGDPTAVTGCGVLNGANVLFSLTADITASAVDILATGTTACITLKGDHNGLLLNGHTITGPGTALFTGIAIQGNHTMLEGFNGTVKGFNTGIADSSQHTMGDDFNVESNVIGLLLPGGHERWFNFFAGSLTEAISASSNGIGVFLNGCNVDCSVANFDASGNTLDGVDVVQSNEADVELFIAANNGANGVHVGCLAGVLCPGNSDVRVVNAFFGLAVSGNGDDGVFLDTSESGARDQVTTISAHTNGGLDLHDATTNCGSSGAFNFWYNNAFTTSSPALNAATACID